MTAASFAKITVSFNTMPMCRPLQLRVVAFAGAALLFAGIVQGCRPSGGQGPVIKTAVELLPDALYSTKAVLNYGGTPVPVDMTREAQGATVKFLLMAHDQVLETETYASSVGEFALVSIDEQFEPPLPLLKFPLTIGEGWTWKGELLVGGRRHSAEADIKPTTEQLYLTKSGGVDTVKVVVELRIDTKTSTPAKRPITYWFVKGKGIVQREIGKATSRAPAPSE